MHNGQYVIIVLIKLAVTLIATECLNVTYLLLLLFFCLDGDHLVALAFFFLPEPQVVVLNLLGRPLQEHGVFVVTRDIRERGRRRGRHVGHEVKGGGCHALVTPRERVNPDFVKGVWNCKERSSVTTLSGFPMLLLPKGTAFTNVETTSIKL